MALNVGVVKIEYVDAPAEPVRGFLFELAGKDLDEGWIGGWDGNVFMEMLQEDLESRAREYALEKALSQNDTGKLASWVVSLPWERHDIMLHLSW